MMNLVWKRMRKDQKGFTLVELLVVVVILGILATLAVQTIGDKSANARANKELADIRTIQSAVELYFLDKNVYPGEVSELVDDYLRAVPTHPDGSSYEIDADGKVTG